MATLYTQKDSNIRSTWLLFSIFLVVIIGAGWVFSRIYGNPGILVIAVLFSSVTSFISFWYSDKIVIRMARGIPATHENAKELYHIVENLAITAGLPTPQLYIVDQPAPNAFATGRDPAHGVIAVTTGLLKKLNKTELEGVLAHELSHIGNRDTLISTMAVILVGFISLVADIFTRSAIFGGFRGRNREGGQAGAILFVIGIAISILAPISAMLIQLSISRKREFLADASGALLTRYPEGLATALEKIAVDTTPLPVATNTTSHLWFDDPFVSGLNDNKKVSRFHRLFMTHPPVEERIKALRGMEEQNTA